MLHPAGERTPTGEGSPYADSLWRKDSTARETCRRDAAISSQGGQVEGLDDHCTSPEQRQLQSLALTPTHCQKEGLGTHCWH